MYAYGLAGKYLTWAQSSKTFTVVNYECYYKAKAFVPGKPCQPNLMFVGNASVEHLKGGASLS
jgi:hypothetical protein